MIKHRFIKDILAQSTNFLNVNNCLHKLVKSHLFTNNHVIDNLFKARILKYDIYIELYLP